MKIADLWVGLGVRGDGDTDKKLNSVKGTISGLKTSSLAAIAAISGIIYGMHKLAAGAMQTGADLTTFAAATGMSIQTLQQWEYAAQRANVPADEMKDTLIGLQKSMINMGTDEAAPWGMSELINTMGMGVKRAMVDQEYLFKTLRDYAKVQKNIPLGNKVLESFGFSMSMSAASRRGMLDDKVLSSMPKFSNSGVKTLSDMKTAMADLGRQWEMGIGKMVIKFGPSMMKDVVHLSTAILKLADAFATLAEKSKFISAMGKAFELLGDLVGGVSGVVDKASKGVGQPLGAFPGAAASDAGISGAKKAGNFAMGFGKQALEGFSNVLQQKYGASTDGGVVNNINVTNNNNVQDGKDLVHQTKNNLHGAIQKSMAKKKGRVKGN